MSEKGLNKRDGRVIVEVDAHYFRPTEVDYLLGDASKAKELLDWKPKVKVGDLIDEMVDKDLKLAQSHAGS